MPQKASAEQIDNYLSLFENNPEDAIRAIQSRALQNRTVDNKPSHERTSDIQVISIKSLSKNYQIGKQTVSALKDISLDVYEGEFIALTGSSGSGKSTLLHMLGCIDRPSSGQVVINNRDVTKLHDTVLSDIRKDKIGFVFQSFYLQPFLRLSDNLAVPAMFTDTKRQTIDTKVSSLLQRVGLSDRADHYPKELSGGQIQRAAIARALMNNPQIILADEPTGNLDSVNSKSIIDLFKSIREKLGTTIVIVTHDHGIARQADRIITLKDGSIV